MQGHTDKVTGLFRDLKVKNRKKAVKLDLHGEATVAWASELLSLLLEAVKQKKPVVIDPSGLKSIDVTAFQLLLATGKTCRQNNLDISIKAVDSQHPFFASARLIGLLPEKNDSVETWFDLPLIKEEAI